MPSRLAATLALLAFAICLMVGAYEADNTFTTTISRALTAMVGTLVVGLIVGWAGQKVVDERIAQLKAASEKNSQAEKPAADR